MNIHSEIYFTRSNLQKNIKIKIIDWFIWLQARVFVQIPCCFVWICLLL